MTPSPPCAPCCTSPRPVSRQTWRSVLRRHAAVWWASWPQPVPSGPIQSLPSTRPPASGMSVLRRAWPSPMTPINLAQIWRDPGILAPSPSWGTEDNRTRRSHPSWGFFFPLLCCSWLYEQLAATSSCPLAACDARTLGTPKLIRCAGQYNNGAPKPQPDPRYHLQTLSCPRSHQRSGRTSSTTSTPVAFCPIPKNFGSTTVANL